ncbi:uncharacterized protein LOC109140769 [Larimichthys crocea]|uniref:uncharacterized protein LOC109140769 n=1 Tax=Larimichthys crocea TaxID=215358 RepID=UPI000F5DD09C|nr:uncharacterized protein LOC109140769 [Larimichthys crocea]
MIVFWVTLLLLHQGYTLVPVTTVQLGEPATFTCVLPDEFNHENLHWYKQSAGENLKLIAALMKNTKPAYGPEFSASRFEVKVNKNISILTIPRTIQEDEGMYHCAFMEWNINTWSAIYLSIKGNSQRTSNYAVVQWSTVSDPVHPGDSVTLQCSVLSDSENKTCSEDHSVFWFRAGSDKSHPDIIYADGNRHDECDKSQKRCVYHFSKKVSSSDDGTYYCAVATCGEILFGNGSKLQIERTVSCKFTATVIVGMVCLIISVIGNIVFICYRTPRTGCEQFKGIESVSSQSQHNNSIPPVNDNAEGGDDLNYAALHLSGRKATRGRKKRETEESVYSQIKYQM